MCGSRGAEGGGRNHLPLPHPPPSSGKLKPLKVIGKFSKLDSKPIPGKQIYHLDLLAISFGSAKVYVVYIT